MHVEEAQETSQRGRLSDRVSTLVEFPSVHSTEACVLTNYVQGLCYAPSPPVCAISCPSAVCSALQPRALSFHSPPVSCIQTSCERVQTLGAVPGMLSNALPPSPCSSTAGNSLSWACQERKIGLVGCRHVRARETMRGVQGLGVCVLGISKPCLCVLFLSRGTPFSHFRVSVAVTPVLTSGPGPLQQKAKRTHVCHPTKRARLEWRRSVPFSTSGE